MNHLPPEDKKEAHSDTKELHWVEAIQSIRKALAPGSEVNRRIQETMKPYVDAFAELAKRIQPTMDALTKLAEAYRPKVQEFSEALRRFEEFNAGLIASHKGDDVSIPPFFNEYTAPELLRLFADPEKSALMVYQEFFSTKENIDLLLASWEKNKFFEDRMPILRDALEAHVNKKFTLSIPALLSQIEGILCEIFDVKDHGEVKSALNKIKFKIDESESPFPRADIISKIIIDQIFLSDKYNHQTKYPNRHLVQHGKSIFYYKDPHGSLRCILLLDLLRSEKFLALNNKESDESGY